MNKFQLATDASFLHCWENQYLLSDGCFIFSSFVTCAQYQRFIDDTDAGYTPANWDHPRFEKAQAELPVVSVSYGNALNFCEWLNRYFIDKISAFGVYRLPYLNEHAETPVNGKDVYIPWLIDSDLLLSADYPNVTKYFKNAIPKAISLSKEPMLIDNVSYQPIKHLKEWDGIVTLASYESKPIWEGEWAKRRTNPLQFIQNAALIIHRAQDMDHYSDSKEQLKELFRKEIESEIRKPLFERRHKKLEQPFATHIIEEEISQGLKQLHDAYYSVLGTGKAPRYYEYWDATYNMIRRDCVSPGKPNQPIEEIDPEEALMKASKELWHDEKLGNIFGGALAIGIALVKAYLLDHVSGDLIVHIPKRALMSIKELLRESLANEREGSHENPDTIIPFKIEKTDFSQTIGKNVIELKRLYEPLSRLEERTEGPIPARCNLIRALSQLLFSSNNIQRRFAWRSVARGCLNLAIDTHYIIEDKTSKNYHKKSIEERNWLLSTFIEMYSLCQNEHLGNWGCIRPVLSKKD